jgi:hypothetical protein
MNHFISDELIRAAKTFEDKSEEYGFEAYKRHGDIMKALFPNGLGVNSIKDFNRFSTINAMVGKMNRIASNFHTGGHADSCHDLAIFAVMLMDLDNDAD